MSERWPGSHVFAGSPVDRAANERRDSAWVEARLADPDARVLPFHALRALAAEPARVAWLDAREHPLDAPDGDTVLLGLRDGVPLFATAVDAETAADIEARNGATFTEVRELAQVLPAEEAAILAQARSLLDWHARHRFCAVCGAPTAPANGGMVRRCEACGAQHFPRVDPVVITLVHRGARCLLARGRMRPGAVYTCVAGFMEPGETIEEAAAREIFEETGVRIHIDGVRYHSSQPWPFPSSLMIGLHAEAASEEVTIDPEEIADAQWYTREEVARVVEASGTPEADELPFRIPPPFTIAHHLIRSWALDT